ncbi:hypothetical protein [Thalassospira sp.]|uniref:hypothetical protein n=1 Tax=Thalassospira sp. TaxID=1912094 RepID=UPI002734E7C0|nr:hypothetical protein [Thalassospira sp.]MDP2697305.1 hypothetical protein [Thalassospira sp.]
MKNINKWWLVVIVFVVALPVIGGLVDHACRTSCGQFCNVWQDLQWESFVAGAFGLMGGIFVIVSARDQIKTMRETTEETVRQARLHRADEACAPLILGREVIDKFRFWAAERIVFLEEIKEQYDSGLADGKIISLALDRSQNGLSQRCEHIKKILDTHTTTTFNYEVSAALELLSKSTNFADTSSPTFVVNTNILTRFHVIIDRLVQARSCSISAGGMIDAQIEAIRDRCGVIN